MQQFCRVLKKKPSFKCRDGAKWYHGTPALKRNLDLGLRVVTWITVTLINQHKVSHTSK